MKFITKAKKMKNILFLVTGMTPQIITETVWALACDPDNDSPWVPDEIHVLSTDDGLNQIRSRLFDDGVFVAMQAEYPQLANIRFSSESLHAICQDGTPVKDLKTPHDNELAADLICQKVREFTSCDDVVLHVSIAGGRKTMGFYAGYALSLYGRACDSMSHVLVDSEFETAKGFYYPTTYDKYVEQNYTQKRLNAKDAKIWLAKIPFVRMREAIVDKHQLKQGASFSEVVKSINESFKEIELTVDLPNKKLIINHQLIADNLSEQQFAFFYWFADLAKQAKGGVIAPRKKSTTASEYDTPQYVNKLTDEFHKYYLDSVNAGKVDFEKISLEEVDIRLTNQIFEKLKSDLHTALKQAFGIEIAKRLQISNFGQRGKPIYLNMSAENITIIKA